MSEETRFESAVETDRETVAAYLRSLADGVEDGADLEFGEEAVTVPSNPTLEVELEREEDGYELEIELGVTSAAPEDATEDAGAAEAGADEAAAVPDAAVDAVELGDPTTGGDASQATFEVYQDRAEEWRWRLVHRNGNVIADSGEGYARRGTAENGLRSVRRNAPGAPIEYPGE